MTPDPAPRVAPTPAPTYVQTGRFAPAGTYAVWDLRMSKARAIAIKRYEDDTFTLAITEGGR